MQAQNIFTILMFVIHWHFRCEPESFCSCGFKRLGFRSENRRFKTLFLGLHVAPQKRQKMAFRTENTGAKRIGAIVKVFWKMFEENPQKTAQPMPPLQFSAPSAIIGGETLYGWYGIMTFKNTIKSCILRTGILRHGTRLFPPTALILAYHSVSDRREEQSAIIDPGITADAEQFEQQMSILRNEYHPITLDDLADCLEHKKPFPRRAVVVTFDDGFADNYHLAAPIIEKYDIRGAIYLAVDAVRRQELPWYCRLHYLFHKAAKEEIRFTNPETGASWNCGKPDEREDAERLCARSCVVLEAEQLEQRIALIESWFGYKLDLSVSSPGMMTFEQAKDLRRRGHIIGSHTFSHRTAGLLSSEELQQEIG
jgi:peptidoglycan/xylan/chitin deacetylase (PgdA/CDA1 family)